MVMKILIFCSSLKTRSIVMLGVNLLFERFESSLSLTRWSLFGCRVAA